MTKTIPSRQPCECGNADASWHGDRNGLRQYMCTECWQAQMRDCIECLHGVVADVLPQIGGIVLQDYERLNRGMILADKILKNSTPRPR